jgi:two-component system sensor histidine kinase KdpD
MDLDALLARRPELALIDELAHTNAEGLRHEKRWQDGGRCWPRIDVYNAVNVQHLETLNDAVARITGVRLRETVPDRVLADASEIELVDIPPRSSWSGSTKARSTSPSRPRATQNFFVKGNPLALRELAMRAAADQVDAQLRTQTDLAGAKGPWPTQDRVLVLVDDSPAVLDAVRAAKRSADRARAEWIALVVTAGAAPRDGAAAALRLTERLDAEVATLEGHRGRSGRGRGFRPAPQGPPHRAGPLAPALAPGLGARRR